MHAILRNELKINKYDKQICQGQKLRKHAL